MDQKLSTNFVQNILRNNHTKFHLNPFSGFKGEDFFQNANDDGRRVMVKAKNEKILGNFKETIHHQHKKSEKLLTVASPQGLSVK